MKKTYIAILLIINIVTQSCKQEQSLINLTTCSCKSIDYNYRKTNFNISDTSKVKKLKSEFNNLITLEDDGRVIFGDTLTLNCQDDQRIRIEINEDYIKVNSQKYKPQKATSYLIRQYKGDAYADKIIKQGLTNIDSTKSLILRDCNIRIIPKEIFQLKKLEYLDLSLNLIKEIPNEISKLKNLKEISFSYNLVERISPQISELKELESLWLLDNKLKFIPEEICKLDKLEELNLNGNMINELPMCMPEMQSLQTMYVGKFDNNNHTKDFLDQIEVFKKTNRKLKIGVN